MPLKSPPRCPPLPQFWLYLKVQINSEGKKIARHQFFLHKVAWKPSGSQTSAPRCRGFHVAREAVLQLHIQAQGPRTFDLCCFSPETHLHLSIRSYKYWQTVPSSSLSLSLSLSLFKVQAADLASESRSSLNSSGASKTSGSMFAAPATLFVY